MTKKSIVPLVLAVSTMGVFAENGQSLPLKEIIIYSSGTAMFERAGELEPNQSVELKFETKDINDLLKSLVVQGGAITTVTYDSKDPITRTLKSFGVDLTDNPPMGQLLNQMRGERVKVFWPNPVTGKIMGVEYREQPVKNGNEERVFRAEYLNLFTEDGLVSIPLAQMQKLQLENKNLESELTQALHVLAGAHDTEKKRVSIGFSGEAKKEVRITYVTEAPVWKTSYRLVLDEKEPFLQGWAIVENTSDEDWENVRLSLVSGRPISFVMNLYDPLYTERPLIQPELYSNLRPQTYNDALELVDDPQAQRTLRAPDLGDTVAFGKELQYSRGPEERQRHLQITGVAAAAAAPKPSFLSEMKETESLAQGEATGELFQYAIGVPVSIPRQKSSMIPIVSQSVSGEKLSIYNQNVQAKHPLNGFRLKNNTDLHLMQGPITVFDSGSYAGDARITDLPPGQERLISYALDLKVEVEPRTQSHPWELVSIAIRHGTFFATKRLMEEKTYNIRNRDTKEKRILVEHPLRQDWELEAPEAAERTRDVYRFVRMVPPGKSEQVLVREKRNLVEEAAVTTLPMETITFYLRSSKVSNEAKEVLRKVQNFQRRLQELRGERVRFEQRSQEISQEQARIRENMVRLAQNSELYLRYVKKFDEQETELETMRKEIENLRRQEATLQNDLNNFLSGIELK